MRTIARSNETVSITGISINQYQVDTCNSYNSKSKGYAVKGDLSERCKAVRGNFLKMPFKNESFDGAYAVEATCHAPELDSVYGEVCMYCEMGLRTHIIHTTVMSWCLMLHIDVQVDFMVLMRYNDLDIHI